MPKPKKKQIGYYSGESSKTVFLIINISHNDITPMIWKIVYDANYGKDEGGAFYDSEMTGFELQKYMQEFIRDRIEDIIYTPHFSHRVQKARLTIQLEILDKDSKK